MPHPEPERRTNAPPGSERLLAGLTPEQAQAVTHGTGPLLLDRRSRRRQDTNRDPRDRAPARH
jgi:hypothetical protein